MGGLWVGGRGKMEDRRCVEEVVKGKMEEVRVWRRW